MGDGTKESPYTREDVLNLVRENGGKAVGLDLSEKVFEESIDLYTLDLKGIFLQLAHLEGANLGDAHLEGASLWDAHLEGAFLYEAHLDDKTDLQEADWGNYILGEEKEGEKRREDYFFKWAEYTYRRLKTWYTNAGMYDIAGEFFFREMTVKRKALKWWPKPWNRAFSKLLSILCGYGEKPERVVVSAIVIIFGLAIVYRFGGLSLPYSIYYSVVSFTALGYGSWVPQPTGWAKATGAAEAVIGVFMMALFLVTFTRKMTG